MSKILRLVRHTAASFASLLVQLFQMVLLKQSYESKGTFSVVFLGFHTKPVCVFCCFFFSYGLLWHCGVYLQSWLAPVLLSFYYFLILLCYTFLIFLLFSKYQDPSYVRNFYVIVKIHVLISIFLLENGRSCFSNLFCVIA